MFTNTCIFLRHFAFSFKGSIMPSPKCLPILFSFFFLFFVFFLPGDAWKAMTLLEHDLKTFFNGVKEVRCKPSFRVVHSMQLLSFFHLFYSFIDNGACLFRTRWVSFNLLTPFWASFERVANSLSRWHSESERFATMTFWVTKCSYDLRVSNSLKEIRNGVHVTSVRILRILTINASLTNVS